jgi:hypothetical protein
MISFIAYKPSLRLSATDESPKARSGWPVTAECQTENLFHFSAVGIPTT